MVKINFGSIKRIFQNDYVFLLLIAILGFFQISFLTDSLKWDIIDGYLPSRFFAGECLKEGILPFWQPYIKLGHPMYTSLITSWYPEIIFMGRIFGYTTITIHILFVFYVYLAGVGFYKLLGRLLPFQSGKINLLLAVFYMLSGFFIGNAQHLNFIIAGAFLPWYFYWLLCFIEKPKFINTAKFFLITYLLISGGYPTVFIFIVYLSVLFVGIKLISFIKNKELIHIRKLVVHSVILILLLSVTCLGLVFSYLDIIPYVSRFSGMGYKSTTINPFTPQSLMSLFYPFAVITDKAFFATDRSMSNAYIGFLTPVLLIWLSFKYRKKSVKNITFLLIALITLFISFGDYSPVHKFFYDYLPLFDRFRHPSIFRLFFIFFILIYLGSLLQSINKDELKLLTDTIFRIVLPIQLGIYLGIGVVMLFLPKTGNFEIVEKGFKNLFEFTDASMTEHVFIQSFVFVFLLLIALVLSRFYKQYRNIILFTLLVLEIIISGQLNAPYTVYSKNKPGDMASFIRNCPESFPIPDTDEPIATNVLKCPVYESFWRNTDIYAKTHTTRSYSQTFLEDMRLMITNPKFHKHAISNPFVYFSDSLRSIEDTILITDDMVPEVVFIQDSTVKLSTLHKQDSSVNDIIIQAYVPDKVDIELRSRKEQLLVMQQAIFPGWRVYVDGNEEQLLKVNGGLMAVKVPKGQHSVLFMFKSLRLSFAFWLMIILWSSILLVVLANYALKEKTTGYKLLLLGFIAIIIVALFPRKNKYPKIQADNVKFVHSVQTICEDLPTDSTVVLLNTTMDFKDILSEVNCTTCYLNIRRLGDAKRYVNRYTSKGIKYIVYCYFNGIEPPELNELIEARSYHAVKKIKTRYGHTILYEKDKIQPKEFFYNNYEKRKGDWTTGNIKENNLHKSGGFSENLSKRQYSSTLQFVNTDVSQKLKSVEVSVAVMENHDNKLVTVFQMKSKTDSLIQWSSYRIPFNDTNSGKWIIHNTKFNVADKNTDNVKLQVFLWNPDLCDSIFVDDFKVTVN